VLDAAAEWGDGWGAVVRRLRSMAPVVVAKLHPGDPQTETLFRSLRWAGYCLTGQHIERRGSEAAALVVFHLREYAAAGLRPLLVHVHIPKCAGTSFQRLLQMSFEDRHCDYYPEDQSRCLTREELVRLVSGSPGMASLSSHSIRLFPPVVWNRLGLYVAFLRDPARRFISNLTYYQKQQETFPESLQRHLPQRCGEMPLRDLARWMLENQPEVVLRSLTMTGFLAEQTWLETVGGMVGLSDHWLDSQALLYPGFGPLQVRLASALLDEFFFVGLVEEMETSVQLLREKLRPHGLELMEMPVPVENVSRELATDTGWLNPSDPVGRGVLDLLEPDLQLYARFRTILRSRFPKTEAAAG